MNACCQCGRPVGRDEVGLTKKLINRGSTEYLCLSCLARRFRVTEDALRAMAEDFRRSGCTLFA